MPASGKQVFRSDCCVLIQLLLAGLLTMSSENLKLAKSETLGESNGWTLENLAIPVNVATGFSMHCLRPSNGKAGAQSKENTRP